jgi:hypothetical protein
MKYELVRDVDYETFPLDPERKWLALVEVCHKNYQEIYKSSREAASDPLLRLQYMNLVVPSRMITFPLGALRCSWQDRS